MVDMVNEMFELGSEEVAYQGHQSLEEAKPQAAQQSSLERELLCRQAFTHRHREGIHGKTDTYAKQRYYIHHQKSKKDPQR